MHVNLFFYEEQASRLHESSIGSPKGVRGTPEGARGTPKSRPWGAQGRPLDPFPPVSVLQERSLDAFKLLLSPDAES